MDTVFVENVEIIGRHGVYEHERSHEQKFLVDIEVTLDTSRAAETDSINDTIDYTRLCDIAREIIESGSVYLVERLASTVADRILKDNRITRVSVTIRKPSAFPSGVPGVTIVREQA